MVNNNVPSNTIDLKSTHDWTMMLKKIRWLVLFASDRAQTSFQGDVALSQRCPNMEFFLVRMPEKCRLEKTLCLDTFHAV